MKLQILREIPISVEKWNFLRKLEGRRRERTRDRHEIEFEIPASFA